MGGTVDKDYPRLTQGYAFEISEEPACLRILRDTGGLLLNFTYDVCSVCRKDSMAITAADRSRLPVPRHTCSISPRN